MLMVTIPKVMSFSGGMILPDMMPIGSNAKYINSLLNTLGEEGRNAYLFRQLPMDMIYPTLFAASWCLVLAWFINKLGKLDGPLFYLCLIPLAGGFFDYLENFGIILILKTYPDNADELTLITNYFTIAKSFLTTLFFIILIILVVLFVVKKSGRK
jgi:hypothetical protein